MRDTDKVSCDARESREQKIDGKKTRRVVMLAAVAVVAGVPCERAILWRMAAGEAGSRAGAGNDFE
jgi:hypothetical protein